MSRIADFINEHAISKLATPSNLKLGRQIADAKGVEFIESTPERLTAKVAMPGIQKRTVVMSADKQKLHYKCTCSNKLDYFCKHCVAVSLVLTT